MSDVASLWPHGQYANELVLDGGPDLALALKAHQDVNKYSLKTGHEGYCRRGVLHMLASYGRAEEIDELCSSGYLDAKALDENGANAAMVAAASVARASSATTESVPRICPYNLSVAPSPPPLRSLESSD